MTIPQSLEERIARDVLYSLAGVMVEVALLYRVDRLQYFEMQAFGALAFVAGLGWVIGIALQVLAGLLGVTSTSWADSPSTFSKWVYRRYHGGEWKTEEVREEQVLEPLENWLRLEGNRGAYERIVTQVTASAALAPAALVSGLLVGWKAFEARGEFDVLVTIGCILTSFILVAFNRVRVMDMTRKDIAIWKRATESEVSA